MMQWFRYAKLAAAWTAVVLCAFVCGLTTASWLILTHGNSAGEPLMNIGAQLIAASRPAYIEGVEIIDPLPGEAGVLLADTRPTRGKRH